MALLRPRRPVDKKWPITLAFGVPGNYAAGVHTGIDFGVPLDTRVVSPRAGTVTVSAYDPAAYGNYVIVVDRSKKTAFLVAHLTSRAVTVGQKVKRGQLLGRSGSTGNSTGPHCHAEQRHAPFGYRDFERPEWR